MVAPKPNVFLDTSVLFAGIWSITGGAHAILQLGEDRAINLVVSSQVLREIEQAFRDKRPDKLGELLLILERCVAQTVEKPTPKLLQRARLVVTYEADAIVLAGAMTVRADYFVTLDRKHFLDNAQLRSAMAFQLGTPGDFLAWYRSRLTHSNE